VAFGSVASHGSLEAEGERERERERERGERREKAHSPRTRFLQQSINGLTYQ
jgi:hypothetical protein